MSFEKLKQLGTLEQEILAASRVIFRNDELEQKDILGWSTNEKSVRHGCQKGEVVARLPGVNVWVCIDEENDNRAGSKPGRGSKHDQ